MANLIIVVLLGLIQAGMAAGGIYVSLETVPKEQHKYWIGGFIAAALFGIALSAWSAHQADLSQKHLSIALGTTEAEAKAAKEKATEASNKLSGLQADNIFQHGQVEALLKVVDTNRAAELRSFADEIEGENKRLYQIKREPIENLRKRALALSQEMQDFVKKRESTAPKQDFSTPQSYQDRTAWIEIRSQYDHETVIEFSQTYSLKAILVMNDVMARNIASPTSLGNLDFIMRYPTNYLGMQDAIRKFGVLAEAIK